MARERDWRLGETRASELGSGSTRHVVISFVPLPIVRMSIFTPGERHVARLLTAGFSNAEIARERRTSLRTVANQVASLLRKSKADSRHQLALRLMTEDA